MESVLHCVRLPPLLVGSAAGHRESSLHIAHRESSLHGRVHSFHTSQSSGGMGGRRAPPSCTQRVRQLPVHTGSTLGSTLLPAGPG